jgi:hypothetical protein
MPAISRPALLAIVLAAALPWPPPGQTALGAEPPGAQDEPAAEPAAPAGASRPNIVFILSDDEDLAAHACGAVLERVSITGRRAAAGSPAVHPAASFILHRWRVARAPAAGPGSAAPAQVHGQELAVHGVDPQGSFPILAK